MFFMECMMRDYCSGLLSHSHRGFSPVTAHHAEVWNRFNGFFCSNSIDPAKKPLKRFLVIV
jgi:hypothetical protein